MAVDRYQGIVFKSYAEHFLQWSDWKALWRGVNNSKKRINAWKIELLEYWHEQHQKGKLAGRFLSQLTIIWASSS